MQNHYDNMVKNSVGSTYFGHLTNGQEANEGVLMWSHNLLKITVASPSNYIIVLKEEIYENIVISTSNMNERQIHQD